MINIFSKVNLSELIGQGFSSVIAIGVIAIGVLDNECPQRCNNIFEVPKEKILNK